MERPFEVPAFGLSEAELQARFDRLQAKLEPLWKTISAINQEEQTIVVVPSVSLEIDLEGSEMQAYEERFLFLLLLLRQPRARMLYITSLEIRPYIIDYYLSLLPGVIPGHARERLHLISPLDCEPIPLTVKLLRRPRLLQKIRSLIPDPDRAHLVPFNSTIYERDLALRLGIPMYGCDPKFERLGTKTGSRELFRAAGMRHPLGFEGLRTFEDVVGAVSDLHRQRPDASGAMVKLNEAVSGQGNAVVDLQGLGPDPSREEIAERVRGMRLELSALNFDAYMARLNARGGIVEQRIVSDTMRSPSVQLRITPAQEVELLSTHDQLLGGPSGQSYLGCVFPADKGYATAIANEARKIGDLLAREGVLGRFAVDFLVAKTEDGWDPYAIELNLRKGGTTHPFLTLQFLTDGSYDAEKHVFITALGQRRCFVATDHLHSELYRAFTPEDLLDLAIRHGIHFDHAREEGVVFHMMAALGDQGRAGLTAVAETPEEADALYRRTCEIMDREAEEALRPQRLPGEGGVDHRAAAGDASAN